MALLWALPTPHICWPLDWFRIMSQPVANHEECHFMIQSSSGDAKARRDQSPPNCWDLEWCQYFEHLVQSHHLFGVWS